MELLWKLQNVLPEVSSSSTSFCENELKKRWEDVIHVSQQRMCKHDDMLHELLLFRGFLTLGRLDEAEKLLKSVENDSKCSSSLKTFEAIQKICSPNSSKTEIRKGREDLLQLKSKWGEAVGNSLEQRGILVLFFRLESTKSDENPVLYSSFNPSIGADSCGNVFARMRLEEADESLHLLNFV